MEKEENLQTENITSDMEEEDKSSLKNNEKNTNNEKNETKQPVEKTPEEKILNLEDKLARTFAEMENQRRRFEKEKEEAYEYGGFAFAKEALNLIDNLERSKQILESDVSLKDTDALKKTLEHLNIM